MLHWNGENRLLWNHCCISWVVTAWDETVLPPVDDDLKTIRFVVVTVHNHRALVWQFKVLLRNCEFVVRLWILDDICHPIVAHVKASCSFTIATFLSVLCVTFYTLSLSALYLGQKSFLKTGFNLLLLTPFFPRVQSDDKCAILRLLGLIIVEAD